MEDFERKDEQGATECPNNNEINVDNSENTATEAAESLPTELCEAESKEVSEPKTVYHWNYDESQTYDNERTKKKEHNGAKIYAIVISAAFLLCFAALILTLLFDFVFTPKGEGADGSITETVVKVEERVVYVKEHDGTTLTTQEIYNKCLPSTVSILVSDGLQTGTGSGFFISKDGYIATANHVIEDMNSVKVILSNGQMYEAKVVDGNEYTDIAVIKIEKNDCPAIAIGKSSKLLVGDDVVAIGTPASTDFAGSMAKGSVSYKNRMLKIYNNAGTAIEKKMCLIQTDALVNPGNSGCPLINEYGEAVGIVTMKLNSTYYEGMCFAIPMDAAMPIINAMIEGKDYEVLLAAVSTKPAVLGISGENVQITADGVYGVKVSGFSANTYDAYAKLKVGDVITEIDGIKVASITEMRLILDKKLPSETIAVTFYRDGQYMTVNVVLGI